MIVSMFCCIWALKKCGEANIKNAVLCVLFILSGSKYHRIKQQFCQCPNIFGPDCILVIRFCPYQFPHSEHGAIPSGESTTCTYVLSSIFCHCLVIVFLFMSPWFVYLLYNNIFIHCIMQFWTLFSVPSLLQVFIPLLTMNNPTRVQTYMYNNPSLWMLWLWFLDFPKQICTEY